MSWSTTKIKTEISQTFAIASPMVVAAVATIALEAVDTVMLGWLGKQQIAGGALVNALYLFMVATTAGLFTALGVSIANAVGAGEREKIPYLSDASIWIALGLSVPVVFGMRACADVFAWAGQPPEILQYTHEYSVYYAWGLPAVFLFFVCREILAGLSRPALIMWVCLFAIPVNVLGNYILMYGKWGFPAMGVSGIALSTVIVAWLMFLVMLVYIKYHYHFSEYRLFTSWPSFSWQQMLPLLRLGGPAAFSFGFESSLFSLTAILMGYFGTVALASHQIAIQCATLSFMVPYGISQAVAIRVGNAYGAKNMRDVYWATSTGMACGLSFACLSSLSFILFPKVFIDFFLDLSNPENQEVAFVGASFLAVAGLFQLVDCVQVLFAGSLRGLKDTFVPMLICIICYSALGLGVGSLLAFKWGFAGRGLWLGLAFGLGFCALLMGWRYALLTRRKMREVESLA